MVNEQYVDGNIELFPDCKLFRLLYDNVTNKFRILCRDSYDNRKLVEEFSDQNPAHFFTRQYGGRANERVYAVNPFGYFQTGLVFEVFKYISERHGMSSVAVSQRVLNYINTHLRPLCQFARSIDRSSFEPSNISSKLELRDYQRGIIESLIFDGYGRGMFEAPTGSGKSFTIANFIYTLWQQYDSSLKCLIFVPNSQLVAQFYSDLVGYGFDPECLYRLSGSMTAKERKSQDISKARVVIANRQYMLKHANELPHIDVLIADEVHTLAAEGSKCVDFVSRLDCSIRVGCSGTIPRDKISKFNLMGLFGRVIYTEDVVNLQNKGYLAQLDIKVVDVVDRYVEKNRSLLFHPKTTNRYYEGGDIAFNDAYYAEKSYVDSNYIKLFYPILVEMKKCEGNILVLFDRLEFGRNIHSYITDNLDKWFPGADVFYADGSTAVKDRETIRAKFEKSSNNILFAEVVVMGTGINIKNLPNIVFMFSGKSMTRVIQSIGRSLRTHDEKERSLLIDSHFNFKYSLKHYRERLKLYSEFYGKDEPDDIVHAEV